MISADAKLQCYLLLGTRMVVQGVRLAWVPLLVYISSELEMGTLATGSVMSSFSLGYLSTQVVGGMLADRYGGKPLQELTMFVMSLGMLIAPHTAHLFGSSGLWVIYFLMGLFAGPQHPAYNSMAAAWFAQEDLGKVSSICEAGPVAGNLVALVVGPAVAASYGWRASFYVFGVTSSIWTAIWHAFAKSCPDKPLENHPRSPSMSSINRAYEDKKCAVRPSKIPWGMALYGCVWVVILQHMVFNGTKYFLADWMPTYYATIFDLQPQHSWSFLMFPELVGICAQLVVSRLEQRVLKSGLTLEQTRKLFGAVAYVLAAFTCSCLGTTTSPTVMAAWLCVMQLSFAMHSCGYKTNYLDITQLYQGLFMGVGNTLASVMTFLVPLTVAATLEAFQQNWWYVFTPLVVLNLFGAVVATRMSVKRIDEELEPFESDPELTELVFDSEDTIEETRVKVLEHKDRDH